MDPLIIIVAIVAVAIVLIALPRSKDKAVEPGAAPVAVPKPALVSPEEVARDPFARWLTEQASAQTGIDLRRDPLALTRIAEGAERARAEIRSAGKSEISLPYLAADASGPKHFTLTVTREQVAALRGGMID